MDEGTSRVAEAESQYWRELATVQGIGGSTGGLAATRTSIDGPAMTVDTPSYAMERGRRCMTT